MVDAPESPRPQQQTPQKPFYQNGVKTNGRAFNSPNWRMKGEESPSQLQSQTPSPAGAGSPSRTNTSRSAFSRPSQHVPQAISERRRLYVGNMPYTAKLEDVQALFTEGGFAIERIDIAIDPLTGRNPSYCFVDLETKDLAERAMTELDGHDLLGRPVKIKPGVVKSASERQQRMGTAAPEGSPRGNKTSPFNAERWRKDDNATAPAPGTSTKFNTNTNTDSSRRLYVGGLPRLTDQDSITSNITNFFKGYNVGNISKLFTPHPAKRFEPGDHYYLFVDFNSAEEAQNAMAALNGAEGPWGAGIRVQRARGENSSSNSEERRGTGRWSSTTQRGNGAPQVAEAGGVEA